MYKALLRPILFGMDAEKAHDFTMGFAKTASASSMLTFLARLFYSYTSGRLSQHIWGLNFANPVGLAAGFDKNGQIPAIIQASGFGFTEIGSITANPSTGNQKPRLFRLPEDQSLINRMGLNNDGAKTIVKRLSNVQLEFPIGINIAKTNDSAIIGDKAIEDYRFSYHEAQKMADYITINISCPNTKDGNSFEDPTALRELLSSLNIRNDARAVPTLVKFSVDLEKDELEQLVGICEQFRIQGYVATNTSSGRTGLKTGDDQLQTIGAGGLSGRAIADKSTEMIRWIHEMTNGQKPIIGVGGVDSVEAALEKLHAGADLLQIYTGLIYQGPGLVKKINRGLVRYLDQHGLDSLIQIPRAQYAAET